MATIETIPYAKSLRCRLVEAGIRILPTKRMTDVDTEQLERLMWRFAAHRKESFSTRPLRGHCTWRTETIGGRPCLIACKAGVEPERAILLFFGGSYFMPPKAEDSKSIAEYACDMNAEVWFPLYPLAPEHSMCDLIESVTDVYAAMLERWTPDRIAFIGNSAGAGNCLYICLRIKHDGLALPYPARLIMLSPALRIPPTEAQSALMHALDTRDCMIPASLCTQAGSILLRDHEDLEYLARALDQDWTGLPPMDVFYGTDEVFSAFAEDLAACADRAGVHLTIHLGEGMMHCWPQRHATPEGRDGRERVKRIILS